MKTVSTALSSHLSGEVTTLATCWKLTLRDGSVLGFTSHDTDLEIDSVTYRAATGFSPGEISQLATLENDTLALEGMLDAAAITDKDLLAGKYDYAAVEIFVANYADLSQGTLAIRDGWLGQVTLEQGRYVVEISGLSQRLEQRLGELYSPTCRADLGDARCGVNLTPFTETGTVTAVESRQVFTDNSLNETNGHFNGGLVTFAGGSNSGLKMEVKQSDAAGTITLVMPMPHAIAVSDAYSIVVGCDKTLTTCQSRFSNALNFRGEPHVPGLDAILETAGTRRR